MRLGGLGERALVDAGVRFHMEGLLVEGKMRELEVKRKLKLWLKLKPLRGASIAT